MLNSPSLQTNVAAAGGVGGAPAISNPGVAYVRTDGNDSTAEIGNPAKPFETGNAAWAALRLLPGGVANLFSFDFGIGDFSIYLPSPDGVDAAAGFCYFIRGAGGTASNQSGDAAGTVVNIFVYGLDATTPGETGGDAYLTVSSDYSAKINIIVIGGAGGNGLAGTEEDIGGDGGNGGNVGVQIYNAYIGALDIQGGAGGAAGVAGDAGEGLPGADGILYMAADQIQQCRIISETDLDVTATIVGNSFIP